MCVCVCVCVCLRIDHSRQISDGMYGDANQNIRKYAM